MSSRSKKPARRTDDPSPAADPRFASIATDPRYRLPSTKNARVDVDKRFSRMFKDDDFSKKSKVDKYGRKISKSGDKAKLERLYTEEKDQGNQEQAPARAKRAPKARPGELEIASASEESEEADDDSEVEAELVRLEGSRDPARDGFSSSDESSSDEEDELEDANVELDEAEEADAVPMGDVSSRVAAVNLDWDNIRAIDLMAVAQSFAPAGGKVTQVTIYPSEFGKERIEQEEQDGPPRDIFASSARQQAEESESEDSEEEEQKIRKQLVKEDTGEEFDTGKLRRYQLDRLKYYYAVITCDSAVTAKALYDAMDGREYLTTANFFDLRFIPDEVSFDDDRPRDECDRLPEGYKPNEFVTEALTHSKVRLTWDDDDTTRKEVQKRAFSRAEIDENDLQAYIGSDSSGEDDDEQQDTAAKRKSDKAEAQRQKMRAALGLTVESSKTSKKRDAGPVGDMQITFASGLSGATNGGKVFENEPLRDETTKERYVRKERERKEKRREKAKAARKGTLEEDGLADESPDPQPPAQEPLIDPTQDDAADPFDDPFFNDAPAAQKAEKVARKAERMKKREEREANEKAAAAQRAELELLMVDDKDDSMRHFNMNEIRKAEKEKKRKKGKKGKDPAPDSEKTDEQGFVMETKDPRFAQLFESHEYAIDPTNPRYKGTSGMKALLDEGRKKRKTPAEDISPDALELLEEKKRSKKSRKAEGDEAADSQDLQKLLASVKAKAKRSK